MTNYNAGRGLEYDEMDFLREKHYLVSRSAGSHSPVDIFAAKDINFNPRGIHRTLLVQCKRRIKRKSTSPPLSVKELEELRKWGQSYAAEIVIVLKNKTGVFRYSLDKDGLYAIGDDWF